MQTNGLTLRVADIHKVASVAFRDGIQYLAKNTLPSKWSENGTGWQEVWQSATRAGFYASCDGILLLDSTPLDGYLPPNVRGLIQSVYDNHLCRVMDQTVEPPVDHQRARQDCTSTTMYVSKFLQASFNRFRPPNSSLVHLFSDHLASVGQKRKGTWGCTLSTSDTRPVLCATAEALIGLSRAGGHRDLIEAGLEFLLNISRTLDEGRRRRVALWAISELAEHAKPEVIYEAATLTAQEWDYYEDRDDDLEVTKYWNDIISQNGYYSYNVRFLFAKATLAFCKLAPLGKYYFRYVIPIVQDVVVRIQDNGGFYKPATSPQVQFWEHFQAMDLLATFLKLVGTMEILSRKSYVLINPVHFHKQAFKVESNLGVVLMPFPKKSRHEWSNDVLKVFESTMKEKGFQCWRADMEDRDDNVMQTIWEHICKARFVIADCTGQNPNVFYELGIADTVGKPVFRCAQDRKDFPFDISGIRSHVYGTLPSQLEGLKKKLASFIEQLLKDDTEVR